MNVLLSLAAFELSIENAEMYKEEEKETKN